MAKLLCIESTSYVCSVAVSKDGHVLSLKESREDRSHGTNLGPFIKEALSEASLTLNDLDAVVVSSGPGSYTGLRIGISMAKGLCYGADIPLISIDTLLAMTEGMLEMEDVPHCDLYCPMIDARRMEVYTALYDENLKPIKKATAMVIDETSFDKELADKEMLFFGNGAPKVLDVLDRGMANFYLDFHPSATHLIALGEVKYSIGQFEDVAYYEPFYLKDFVATTPKKNKVS